MDKILVEFEKHYTGIDGNQKAYELTAQALGMNVEDVIDHVLINRYADYTIDEPEDCDIEDDME